MTPRPKLTRRAFLKLTTAAGGGLLISSYLAACTTDTPAPTVAPTLAPTLSPQPSPTPLPEPTATPAPEPPFEPNLFVHIDPDGLVTLTIHRSEMGQGVRTSLAMILADELEAEWAKIKIVQAPANTKFDSQITSGSGTVSGAYDQLRQAGALARETLMAAAAQIWNVAPTECKAEQGVVTHTATGKQLGYGELVKTANTVTLTGDPKLKDPSEFKLIGKSMPRVDDPLIVSGRAVYGLDVRLPGQLFAVLARCPVEGGKVVSFDDSAAKAVAGVKAVVEIPNGVAVVAENTWAAIQGRAALTVTWDEGSRVVLSSDSIRQLLVTKVEKAIVNESAGELETLDAIYETPALAHAAMEPLNCVADVRADQCTLWISTQNPVDVQTFVRNAIGVPTEVNVTLVGGGFGRRLEVDYAVEAAYISKAAGVPVQLVWTRDDDLQHDFYREPTYHWLRAGWDKQTGELGLWRHYMAAPGINGLAYHGGQDVLQEGLDVSYQLNQRRTQALLTNMPLPTGPWRAVMNGPNAFANECFLDEVAATLKQDPLEFRLSLLSDSDRLKPVVELAASKANWGQTLPDGHAQGIACHTTYGLTSVAMVAEVSVEAGVVKVHKVVCAVDCGTVVHPDMVTQQMEGGIVFGLTSLLKNEITFDKGRVQQSNFNDYPLLQLAEMPVVEVYIQPSTRGPQGVGEMAVPPIVPAVANAIFAATGNRIRRAPLRAEDLA